MDLSLGKSTLALDIAARVDQLQIPDGTSTGYPGDVIVLSAEDSISDTIRPCLAAAGADLSRIRVFQSVIEAAGPRPPELPGDLHFLESLIIEDAATFVVVDPLMAFLAGRIDSHRDSDIRRADML